MHWPEEVCALVLKIPRVTDYKKTVPPAAAGTRSIRFLTSDMYSPTHGPKMDELKAPTGQRRPFASFLPKERKPVQIGKARSSNVEPVSRHKGRPHSRYCSSTSILAVNLSRAPISFQFRTDRQILTTMQAILLTTLKENESQTAIQVIRILLFIYFLKHGTRLAFIPANGKLTNSSRQRFTFSFFNEPAPGKS